MSITRPINPGPGRPVRLPRHAPGLRIGLFGGSFNPPHEGHRLASLIALNRLQLDSVWWLVTPGNPLKRNDGLPDLGLRLAAARKLASHPRIVVTDLEGRIGTRFSIDTIIYLRQRCPGVYFVWLMGADNLFNFHRWRRWREIAQAVPIAVIDRPGSTLRGMNTRGGALFTRHRYDETDAPLLARAAAPAFTFLHGPRSEASSTELRKAGATGP
jgi:nicotinate-nucleotide adenylyltransferase